MNFRFPEIACFFTNVRVHLNQKNVFTFAKSSIFFVISQSPNHPINQLLEAGLEPACPSLGAQKTYGKRANHCSAFLTAPTHAWVVWLSWLYVPEPSRDVKSTPLTDHEIFTLYRGQTRKRLRDMIHMLHLWPDFQNFDRVAHRISKCASRCAEKYENFDMR